MTDWPGLSLVLFTYNRREYAERTLRAALDKLHYSGPLHVHIADDGSGHEYQDYFLRLAGGYATVQSVGVTDAQRGGYGKSYNLAIQAVHQHSGVVLPLEDDWELMKALDLDPLVAALSAGKFGCMRLGYLGITQPLRGELVIVNEALWLLLDPSSEERHIFSGHPRLETAEWERVVGPWPEGLDPNQTEFNVAAIARKGIVWPVNFLPTSGGLFTHFGAERARYDTTGEVVLVGA